MTIDDLKKHDKHIREIQNPFGTDFPALRSLAEEWAKESGLSVHGLSEQYIARKWKK